MADEAQRGLFFPGEAAAAAVPSSAGAPPRAAAPDPTIDAAAAELVRPRKRLINRRLAIRWAGWGSILLVLAGWGKGFLDFFRPGKTSPFGSVITAGTIGELQVGQVKQVTDGKFWLTRVPEGFLALWWKCPHLGCTVPWKETDPVMAQDQSFANQGRFNCPCHGSIYDRYGQIVTGPAPRPMDAFEIAIEGERIRVNTGKVITRETSGPGSDAITRV